MQACAAFLFLAYSVHPVRAATVADVVRVDLAPLIDDAARYATRFAVDITHPVSASSQGQWTDNGATSTWTYTARIDTAVSLSFHASRFALPASAVLTVTGTRGSAVYRARDVNRGELWARPLPGDTLSLSLSVKNSERSAVALDIQSFQAGYRSLGSAVPDNAYYRKRIAASAPAGSCTENYSCDATAANQGPAHSTVAIVVGNVLQCTGTLLNDTTSDGKPYVLTARHCENGLLGGGDPGAAASVTVYWDAVTPCGGALSTIYDGNAITQSGATTIVEQQDAWLLQLDGVPAAADAFYAGWDATGGTFSGGYSVHHALGYDKQYADWYGQAIAQNIPGTTLKLGYASDFWGVVNQKGSVGAGASGGALFDPNNRAVGSATLAQLLNGANSAGVCPATPLASPSPGTITAQYTSLASVWNSTADTTSSTGAATLQSTLDSAQSGKLVIDGVGLLPITLTSDQTASSVFTGDPLTLSWTAPGAQSCTASGGVSGDGWSGSQAASGSLQLTEQAGGSISYTLSCTGAGLVGSATVVDYWQFVPAYVAFTGTQLQVAAGSTIQLQWAANTKPCTASGGIAGDGWVGSKASFGSQNLVVSTLGTIVYTLTCGSGGRVGSAQYTVTAISPSISSILPDGNQLRVGQPVNLSWSDGGLCTASGGGTGDGWAGSSFGTGGGQTVTEAIAGTYTYTVTCSGGGQSASSSVSLTFTNAVPAVALTSNPTQAEIYTDTGAGGIANLNWTSNVRPCAISYTGPGNVHGQVNNLTGSFPSGSAMDSEGVAGAYLYTLTCGTGSNQTQATATVNWFTNQPAVTLSTPNPWPLGFASGVGWNSNVYPCTGTGGVAGDGWAGSKAGPSGSQTLTESTPGNATFTITCGSGSQIVQAQATTVVTASTATIAASAGSLAVNQTLVINWTSNFEPCTSSISPGGSGGWGSLLPKTGGFQTTEYVPGTYTYTINCDGAQASTQVIFIAPTPTASLSASTATSTVNAPVTLTWSSANDASCTGSGGTPGDGWSGTHPSSGYQGITSSAAEVVTYVISCVDALGQAQAQAQVTYAAVSATDPSTPTPLVTLTASGANETVGSQVTLNWNAQNASACAASGGAIGDGWTGDLPVSGSMSISEASAGSFSYDITCSGAPPAATAQAIVIFAAAASNSGTGSGSGSKGGGGGALGSWFLLLLGLLVFKRQSMTGKSCSSSRLVIGCTSR
jgi:hypothetical protein